MANRFRGGGGVSLKPENSLKRAEELIGVGQKQNALQTLHDTLTNKRHQRNWNTALEQVMLKHIDLCVETKSGRKCKDALINYRNTVQGMNVGSLELVIDHLITTASARAEQAQQAAQAKLEDIADLEADASPEEMMLSYVSGEKSADRTDRELVTPWFKFLWETYRNVLDVLRNNSRLEALYASGADRAFAFCLAHKRSTEFRRLCDILRNHLSNLLKYRDQGQQHRTDLSNSTSWELYMDMRFEQLRAACELELWAEAFRSVEDIQGLLALAPKGAARPRAARMATYYARLTQIFTRSGARLYNAAAWARLAAFSRAHGRLAAPEDAAALAANVVLSALAVMPYDEAGAGVSGAGAMASPDGAPAAPTGLDAERAARMAAVLGFPADARGGGGALSRAALLADAERRGLLAAAPPVVARIHEVLEGDFDPLALCARLAPLLEALPGALPPAPASGPVADWDLGVYVPYLQQVALAHTVRQLSHVYSVMRVEELARLAPALGHGAAERLVVEGVRAGYFSARFDHRRGTVHFGGRGLEGEHVRGHVADLARALGAALGTPGAGLDAGVARAGEERRAAAAVRAAACAEDANRVALSRKRLIEKRKEEAEAAALDRERAAEEVRAAAEAAAREAEERRKAQERARRETERIQREMEEREQEELKTFLASKGRKVADGERLDAAAITQEVRSEAAKAAAELARRLARLAKSLDHAERARREEEAPLLERAWAARAAEDADLAAELAAQAARAARAAWEADVAEKARLALLAQDREAFAEQVQARRAEEFAAARAAARRAAEERRAERRRERDIARRREYARRCRLQIEEKRKAEEEAARALEAERRKAEAAERQRKLDEIAARQRQREAEIEAKRAAESLAGPAKSAGAAPAVPAATPAATAAAPAAGAPAKYVPRHLRGGAAPAAGAVPGASAGAPRDEPRRGAGAWQPSGAAGSRVPRRPDDRPAPPPARREGERW
ncbi:EIF3A [Auxenochlorella protothecoides x Auxenochlorella symbiontica]